MRSLDMKLYTLKIKIHNTKIFFQSDFI